MAAKQSKSNSKLSAGADDFADGDEISLHGPPKKKPTKKSESKAESKSDSKSDAKSEIKSSSKTSSSKKNDSKSVEKTKSKTTAKKKSDSSKKASKKPAADADDLAQLKAEIAAEQDALDDEIDSDAKQSAGKAKKQAAKSAEKPQEESVEHSRPHTAAPEAPKVSEPPQAHYGSDASVAAARDAVAGAAQANNQLADAQRSVQLQSTQHVSTAPAQQSTGGPELPKPQPFASNSVIQRDQPGVQQATVQPTLNLGLLSIFMSPFVLPGFGLGVVSILRSFKERGKQSEAALGGLGVVLSIFFVFIFLSTLGGGGSYAQHTSAIGPGGYGFDVDYPVDFNVGVENSSSVTLTAAAVNGVEPLISVTTTPLGVNATDSFKENAYSSITPESLNAVSSSFESSFGISNLQFSNGRDFSGGDVSDGLRFDLTGTGGSGAVQGAYIITIGQNTSYNMWIFADQDSWESRNGEWEHVINSLTPDIQ